MTCFHNPWMLRAVIPVMLLGFSACAVDAASEEDEVSSVAQALQQKPGKDPTQSDRFKCVSWCIDQCCGENCSVGDLVNEDVMACSVECLRTFCDHLDSVAIGTASDSGIANPIVEGVGTSPIAEGVGTSPITTEGVGTSPISTKGVGTSPIESKRIGM